MDAEQIMALDDFKACEKFHGHVCPGLSIGYRAAKAGLKRLAETRSEDEEIVAIVENNSCSVDAIQTLTGCTFGKGNFFFKDYGKQVFTLASRQTGKGVRVSLKAGALEPSPRHRELMNRRAQAEATAEDEEEFKKLHKEKIDNLLTMPEDKLFEIRDAEIEMPSRARIEPSVLCENCGEPTMASKLVEIKGKKICEDCM